MKKRAIFCTGSAWFLPVPAEALAANAAGSYAVDALGGIFMGFCVLLVTVQLTPTLLLLVGTVKSFVKKGPVAVLNRGVWVRER